VTTKKTPAKPVAAHKSPKSKTERPKRAGMGALDAAAIVLAKAKEPMRSADLAKRILDEGLWSTKGKTPAATLNAAIIREIHAKGKESRFRKTGRGLFAATGTGA
jgi:hypothetical protein